MKKYKEETEEFEKESILEGDDIEEVWRKLKEKICVAMTRKEKVFRRKELGHKDWWDKECTRKKNEVKRIYTKWRGGKIERESYIKKKKKLRELFEKKQKDKRRKEEEKFRKFTKENEVWQFLNK